MMMMRMAARSHNVAWRRCCCQRRAPHSPFHPASTHAMTWMPRREVMERHPQQQQQQQSEEVRWYAAQVRDGLLHEDDAHELLASLATSTTQVFGTDNNNNNNNKMAADLFVGALSAASSSTSSWNWMNLYQLLSLDAQLRVLVHLLAEQSSSATTTTTTSSSSSSSSDEVRVDFGALMTSMLRVCVVEKEHHPHHLMAVLMHMNAANTSRIDTKLLTICVRRALANSCAIMYADNANNNVELLQHVVQHVVHLAEHVLASTDELHDAMTMAGLMYEAMAYDAPSTWHDVYPDVFVHHDNLGYGSSMWAVLRRNNSDVNVLPSAEKLKKLVMTMPPQLRQRSLDVVACQLLQQQQHHHHHHHVRLFDVYTLMNECGYGCSYIKWIGHMHFVVGVASSCTTQRLLQRCREPHHVLAVMQHYKPSSSYSGTSSSSVGIMMDAIDQLRRCDSVGGVVGHDLVYVVLHVRLPQQQQQQCTSSSSSSSRSLRLVCSAQPHVYDRMDQTHSSTQNTRENVIDDVADDHDASLMNGVVPPSVVRRPLAHDDRDVLQHMLMKLLLLPTQHDVSWTKKRSSLHTSPTFSASLTRAASLFGVDGLTWLTSELLARHHVGAAMMVLRNMMEQHMHPNMRVLAQLVEVARVHDDDDDDDDDVLLVVLRFLLEEHPQSAPAVCRAVVERRITQLRVDDVDDATTTTTTNDDDDDDVRPTHTKCTEEQDLAVLELLALLALHHAELRRLVCGLHTTSTCTHPRMQKLYNLLNSSLVQSSSSSSCGALSVSASTLRRMLHVVPRTHAHVAMELEVFVHGHQTCGFFSSAGPPSTPTSLLRRIYTHHLVELWPLALRELSSTSFSTSSSSSSATSISIVDAHKALRVLLLGYDASFTCTSLVMKHAQHILLADHPRLVQHGRRGQRTQDAQLLHTLLLVMARLAADGDAEACARWLPREQEEKMPVKLRMMKLRVQHMLMPQQDDEDVRKEMMMKMMMMKEECRRCYARRATRGPRRRRCVRRRRSENFGDALMLPHHVRRLVARSSSVASIFMTPCWS